MSPPRFITFEGIDGSGKSSQARRLYEKLADKGIDTLLTREPGGAPGAELIRELLVEGAGERWSPEVEILLFFAARRDHLEKKLRPALSRDQTVICDRFVDSTRVYQGAVRGALKKTVNLVHEAFIQLEPDLVFILDIEPKIALARGLARDTAESRFEEMGLPFQERLREGFRTLARSHPRYLMIDASKNEDAIADAIWHAYKEHDLG